MTGSEIIPQLSRDPSGAVFRKDNLIYRRIHNSHRAHYDHLIDSGLYQNLVKSQLLIPHEEVRIEDEGYGDVYKIIKPEPIPFISYVYEWCFSQLKEAALTTLAIQKTALKFGMSLKDASSKNIQFRKGRPVLIDTLSFEKYQEDQPWIAYEQFCRHFIAPLAIMRYKDARTNQLFRIYLDGIPLDLASNLLPIRTYVHPNLFAHIHLHSKSQRYFSHKNIKTASLKMSRFSFLGLIDNLESMIKGFRWRQGAGDWDSYYYNTNYSPTAFRHKQQLVADLLTQLNPHTVWDMGSNRGVFSLIAASQGRQVISFDSDFNIVEQSYRNYSSEKITNILPLFVNLINPSPSIGWSSSENLSLIERGPTDTVLALALIHHLAIKNNIPLENIADFFGKICNALIIEFIPKEDSQMQRLLMNREDIFPVFTKDNFEKIFQKIFKIIISAKINESNRIIYLMKKNAI